MQPPSQRWIPVKLVSGALVCEVNQAGDMVRLVTRINGEKMTIHIDTKAATASGQAVTEIGRHWDEGR